MNHDIVPTIYGDYIWRVNKYGCERGWLAPVANDKFDLATYDLARNWLLVFLGPESSAESRVLAVADTDKVDDYRRKVFRFLVEIGIVDPLHVLMARHEP